MLTDLLSDEMLQVSWRSKPGSFVSLMTLYESNYVRLGWLAPNLHAFQGEFISDVPDDCRLYLRIEDRGPYTTTFTLTYLFETPAGEIADPDLQVRVYHDAKLAEVLYSAGWHRHELLQSIRSGLRTQMSERWLRNMMLNKWLDYCVERKHRFRVSQ
jgi:uncharacterized protein